MKIQAIRNLYPQVISTRGDLAFDIDEQPVVYDEALVTQETARLQAEYDAQEYHRKRAKEYPSITDQLDTLYHGGYDAWKATIKAVKDKYPKE